MIFGADHRIGKGFGIDKSIDKARIKLGSYNQLIIKRQTSVGLFLVDEDDNDILLPNKYVPETFELGEKIDAFCYLDNEERPVATTLKPYVQRDEFAFLQVAEVSEYGAFLDWGLEKHLLVPFREQRQQMLQGEWYVIYCYLDSKSFRLVASSRLDRFLSNEEMELRRGEEVKLMVSRKTDLGWELIVNNKHKGLVYSDGVFEELNPGDKMLGYVKKIRDDQKLDISLQPLGHQKLEPSAEKVYDMLLKNKGVLKLHDRSDPEEVKAKLQMSKKTFKKAIGILYKSRKITIKEDGIYKI